MIQFQQNQNPTLEEEIKVLKTLDKSFTIKVEKKSDGNIDLKITIDKSLFSNDNNNKNFPIKEDLKFLFYIKKNFPIGNPNLYCLSQIFFQDLCDIRDILPDLLNKRWGKNKKYYHIKTIIEKIPPFINNYIEKNYSQENNNNNKNKLPITGKFHLDSIYQNRHLLLFPYLFFDNVYEKVFFENSELYSNYTYVTHFFYYL